MPVHDWTRVEAGRFHAFHSRWSVYLADALNERVLPHGYYADPEQVAKLGNPDVVTLRKPPTLFDPSAEGGLAVASPPRVSRSVPLPLSPAYPLGRRVLVRYRGQHEVVAFVEIVSPANQDRSASVRDFAVKVADSLQHGVHVTILDVLPAGRHDPDGMHGAVVQALGGDPENLPSGEPLLFASYAAGEQGVAHLGQLKVGSPLPPMPLFLTPDFFVEMPLEESYQAVWRRIRPEWGEELERPADADTAAPPP